MECMKYAIMCIYVHIIIYMYVHGLLIDSLTNCHWDLSVASVTITKQRHRPQASDYIRRISLMEHPQTRRFSSLGKYGKIIELPFGKLT